MAVGMHENGHVSGSVPAYMDDDVSLKVIRIIQSYVGIINKIVWRKHGQAEGD